MGRLRSESVAFQPLQRESKKRNAGCQMLVKYWKNTGQILVNCKSGSSGGARPVEARIGRPERGGQAGPL